MFALLGLVGIVGSVLQVTAGGFLLAALLLWPTVSFLAAPCNSLSAQRAALPPDLREHSRTEYLRYGKRRVKLLCQAPPCETVARGPPIAVKSAAARLRCARSLTGRP